MLAVDPQSGRLLSRAEQPANVWNPGTGGGWYYFVETTRTGDHWDLAVTGIDSYHDGVTRMVALGSFPAGSRDAYQDLGPVSVSTLDGRQLVVTAAAKADQQWITRVYKADAATNDVSQPLAVFTMPRQWSDPPEYRSWLSPDGQRLYVVQIGCTPPSCKRRGSLDTNTLEPIGHWLRDIDVNGLQLSVDDGELFVASPETHMLYVLDATTGERCRSFDHGLGQPFGFVLNH